MLADHVRVSRRQVPGPSSTISMQRLSAHWAAFGSRYAGSRPTTSARSAAQPAPPTPGVWSWHS